MVYRAPQESRTLAAAEGDGLLVADRPDLQDEALERLSLNGSAKINRAAAAAVLCSTE